MANDRPPGGFLVLVTCSDRRNGIETDMRARDLASVYWVPVAVVRTGGASVLNVRETLRDLAEQGARYFIAATHTHSVEINKGCGWAGRLAVEIKAPESGNVERYISDDAINAFRERNLLTRRDIERENARVQTELLQEILKGTNAVVLPGITLDNAVIPSDDKLGHILAVTKTSTVRFSVLKDMLNAEAAVTGQAEAGNYNVFVSAVSKPSEAFPDVRLFTGVLHIRDVRVISQNPTDNEPMRLMADQLRQQDFMRGVAVTLITAADRRKLRS